MPITHIFHISDIHIRNGDDKLCRYKEYNDVFTNLFDSIRKYIDINKLADNTYVIVVTGDIFHNKNVIGNYGLKLYKKFIKGLTSMGKTIIFHGNHDRNQNELNQPSLVSSTIEIDNLILLEETESFNIDNIAFSYVNIDDTLDAYKTSGRINDLPMFPLTVDAQYKIALFHGTFANVKLYNGTEAIDSYNPYPFEWLSQQQEFDFALFGDIHLRQYGKYKNTIWGYAGSLIQQNFGEDPIQHGYMVWNLLEKKIDEINVYNPYASINLKSDNNIIMVRIRHIYQEFETFLQKHIQQLPKHFDIKLYSDIDIQKLMNILNKYSVTCNITNKEYSRQSTIQTSYNDMKIDKETMTEYFRTYLTTEQYAILTDIIKSYDTLLFDTSKYPHELHDECRKKNKDLSLLINSCMKSEDDRPNKPAFVIKYLEWKNIYCYEDTNYIDFEKASYSTFLIAGNNGTGKSAIYDILTLAIWGDITTSKQNKLSSGIINYNHKNASTSIDIEIADIKYRITRKFNISEGKKCMNKAHIYLYKYISDNSLELCKKDNACNEEITKLFGNMSDFLTASMVTQNMDFDILKMEYKQCLSLIDKTANIDYIYHLYNLFKGCHNKYKDFRKVIESKREVYEKLITSIQPLAYEEHIDRLNLLQHEFATIQATLSSHNIHTLNEIDLEADYEKLLTDIEKPIISDEEYHQALKQYNELSVFFKDYNNAHINQLSRQYDTNIVYSDVYQPCDYELIMTEEKLLSIYHAPPTLQKQYKDITETLSLLQNRLLQSSDKCKSLLENKPPTVMKPSQTSEELNRIIIQLYNSTENLLTYCKNNAKPLKTNIATNTSITYTEYLKYVCEQEHIEKLIIDYKLKLDALNISIYQTTDAAHNITHVIKPECDIDIYTSVEIANYLDSYDITEIEYKLKEDYDILELFYKALDEILHIERCLDVYKCELNVFDTDEYKYNPDCECCQTRPWVLRIKELNVQIQNLETDLRNKYELLFENAPYDYIDIYFNHERNKSQYDKYLLYRQWVTYYTYKESYDTLTKSLHSYMSEKDDLQSSIKHLEDKLMKISANICSFQQQTFDIYKIYCDIQAYNIYSDWKTLYDNESSKKETIEKEINTIKEYLKYETEIRPRMLKLEKLKEQFKAWENSRIYKAFLYESLEHDIRAYEKYKRYSICKSMQPLVIRKKILECEIAQMNELIVKNNTILEYYNANQQNYMLLSNALDYINNIIELIEVIISTFKEYRKELYSSHILKNLVIRANQYIQTLCHTETKKFELDYFLTEEKDSIHINWLVKTSSDDKKYLISVCQASGFQQFAISMALRMSICANRQCNQLFIDEGFTACDKLNISIVPLFLKALLKTFHTIVIVSHIDVIQDSIDNIAAIKYDKTNKSSKLTYGMQKKIVKN